jgi:uncharacterized protein
MSRIVHFEIPSNDLAVSRKFYENVLGWKFFKWEGPSEYWLISTGEPNTPGIDGGLGGAANEMKGTVNTAEVENLDESLAKVKENGGEIIMPREEIPGVGWLAYIREPGGGVLGLIQNMPGSTM